MLNENEIKVMTCDTNITGENVRFCPTYLIHNVGNDNYFIHRELQEQEQKDYEKKEIFSYRGKTYLACIVNCSSEESAEIAVRSYWGAVKKLNDL